MKYYKSDLFKKYFDDSVTQNFTVVFKATIKNELLKTDKEGFNNTESLYTWFLHKCLLLMQQWRTTALEQGLSKTEAHNFWELRLLLIITTICMAFHNFLSISMYFYLFDSHLFQINKGSEMARGLPKVSEPVRCGRQSEEVLVFITQTFTFIFWFFKEMYVHCI